MNNAIFKKTTFAVLTLLAVTGCATSESGYDLPNIPEPEISSFYTVSAESDLKYPLLQYMTSQEQDELRMRIQDALADRCELKFGVDEELTPANYWDVEREYFFPGYNPLQWGAWTYRDTDKGGFETLDEERSDKSTAKPYPPLVYAVTRGIFPEDGSLKASDIVAEDGTVLPDGGCGRAAIDEVIRIMKSDFDTVKNPVEALTMLETAEKMWVQSTLLTEADSRVAEVKRAWSECMAREGYDFADRGEVGGDYGRISNFEMNRKLTIDVDCAIETNYVGVHATVQGAYQEVLIEQNQTQMTAIQETIKAHERALRAYIEKNPLW